METQTTPPQFQPARLAGLLFLIAMATGTLRGVFYVHFPSALVVSGDTVRPHQRCISRATVPHRHRQQHHHIRHRRRIDLGSLFIAAAQSTGTSHCSPYYFEWWRLPVAYIAIIHSYVAMQFISDADKLTAFSSAQLQALTILARYLCTNFQCRCNISWVGIDSLQLSILQSGYIPRASRCLGIFASALLLISQFAIIFFQRSRARSSRSAMHRSHWMRSFLGFWLLIKGVKSRS
ncbi:MAG: hypothetical protein WDO15_09605 [Bacteroidota bacterium]